MKTRSISVPDLKFGKWQHWSSRELIKGSEYPGIYMLAVSTKDLAGSVVKYADVSYIGMTNSLKGLKGRWHQLDRSINGKSGHSGGNAMRKKLGEYKSWKRGLKLYVCAFPVECDVRRRSLDDLHWMGTVCYLEYRAFAEFLKQSGAGGRASPEFNTR